MHDWNKDESQYRLPLEWDNKPLVKLCLAITSEKGVMGVGIENATDENKRFKGTDMVMVLRDLKNRYG